MCMFSIYKIHDNSTGRLCFADGDPGSLNQWSLMHLINTIAPGTFADIPADNRFYAAIDYGRTIEDKSDPLQVLWPLGLNSQQLAPAKIFLNYPPYVNTSHYFITIYGNSDVKPAIGILGMFGTETLGMAIDQLRCLAKLKYLKFPLVPWNIEDFRANVNDACRQIIDEAVSSNRFTEEIKNVQHLIQFVTEMSQSNSSIVENWCPVATELAANL